MHKFGLKLWSTNVEAYLKEAKKLYEKGVYDFIELYVVPESLEYISLWKSLEIPYVIHAPHMAHGVNLADRAKEKYNMEVFSQVQKYADELNAKYIIFHCEANGSKEETVRQLNIIKDNRILVENVPAIVSEEDDIIDFFVGVMPEEIKFILKHSDVGFVLDVGHAIAAANYLKFDFWQMINRFLKLKPKMFHISDTDTKTIYDDHYNIGNGDFDFYKFLDMIPDGSIISIETMKKSKENLDDFCEDIKILRNV
jgi:sugar phosphate isomerase/epimerase